MRVILYTKPECHLCHDVEAMLARLQDELQGQATFQVIPRNILEDSQLFQAYRYLIPVVVVERPDGRQITFHMPIPQDALREALLQGVAGA